MTLIALSISGMSCAQSDTENTAKKQETVQQEFVKERRAQAKMAKNLIEQKVLKDAKKQAKQLKKEGWQPAPGTLPLEKQLTDVYTRMYTYEDASRNTSSDVLQAAAPVQEWHASKP